VFQALAVTGERRDTAGAVAVTRTLVLGGHVDSASQALEGLRVADRGGA